MDDEAPSDPGKAFASKGYCGVRSPIRAMPPSKEPPDKTRHGSTREIEMSNSTTARFLGGTPKAWMVPNGGASAHVPSRKTLQYQPPRTSHLPQNHQPPTPTQSCLASHIQTEFMDSTSEQQTETSHVYSSAGQPKSPERDNVLPSPAPSEEHRHEIVSLVDTNEVQPQQLGANAPSDASHFYGNESHAYLTGEHGGIETIQKHRRTLVGHQDIAREQSLQLPTMTPPASHSELGGRGAPDVESNPPSITIAGDGARIQTSSALASPHSQSRSYDSSHTAPISCTIGPTQNPLFEASVRHFVDVLHAASRARRNPQSREGRITGSRFGLLEDAVKQHDYFYLMLHQIYCLGPQSLTKIRETCPGFDMVHWHGLGSLGHLLIDNSALEADALQWFQGFPFSIDVMLKNYAVFGTAYTNILAFLEKFAHKWPQVKEESKARCCPPSAQEMKTVFGNDSVVLQGVMFRAIHRLTWTGKDDRCYLEGENVFFSNQQEALRQRTDPAQMQALQEGFINRQRQLWVHHKLHCCVDVPPRPESATVGIVPAQQTQRSNQAPPMRTSNAPRTVPNSSFPHEGQPRKRGRPPLNITKWRVEKQNVPIATRVRTPVVPSSSPSQSTPTTRTASPTHSLRQRQMPCPSPPTLQSMASPHFPGPVRSIHDPGPAATIQGYPRGPSRTWSIPTDGGMQMPSQIINSMRGPQSTLPRSMSRDEVVAYLGLREASLPNVSNNVQSINAGILTSTDAGLPTLPQFNGGSIATGASTGNVAPNPPPPTNMVAPQQTSNLIFGRVDQYPQVTTHSAVHQAHVRSPVTEVHDPMNRPNATAKYFTYIKDIAILPDTLHMHKRHLSWTFDLSKDDAKSLATYFQAQDGSRARRVFRKGSMLYRFRSVKIIKTTDTLTESEWVAADNFWPSGIAILLNGRGLEVRRKLHHGKDLAIDFTPALREGVNSVSVAISQTPREEMTAYSFGLERLCLTTDEIIKNEIKIVSWDLARDRILRSSGLADSEVEVLDPTITLDLTDPFSSSLCQLPVRSALCRHNQCFDLDIFLSTRSSKVPTEPCSPDQFRCPICGADARPKNLQIDGFFMRMRAELELIQRLDIKAVVLDEHGDWKIKEIEETGERGDGTGKRVIAPVAAPTGERTSGRENEVIELDDD